MDKVREYFKGDRLAENLGMELVDYSPGHATVKMPVQDCHLNAMEMVHGGTLFALADYTFAVAANSHGTAAVAINAHIHFTKGVASGTLTAKARETSMHPKIATYTVDITDDAEDLVASFTGMVYRKKTPIEEIRQMVMDKFGKTE